MLTLVPLLLVTLQTGPTIGDHFFAHAGGGPDPFEFTIRPLKVPTCQTDEQIRKALAEKEQGLTQSCLVRKAALPEKPQPR